MSGSARKPGTRARSATRTSRRCTTTGPSGPDGSPYLVMEFVDGPSLADLLAVDPIEPARALDVIAQAAEGLAAAHKAGVIHRDIKPGNILISSEGQVKVTDFGIAHAAGQAPVTAPGLVMGTTQYMAPERIAGNPGTAASDLYALGIVLHECLTGMPPHDGTAAEVMAAHLYLPLPPLPADVPAELDVLVDRLTTKDPARRISDARELADLAARLRDAIGGGRPRAARARRGAVRAWCRRSEPGLAVSRLRGRPVVRPGGRQRPGRWRPVQRAARETRAVREHGAACRCGRLRRARLRLGRVERAAAHVAAHGSPAARGSRASRRGTRGGAAARRSRSARRSRRGRLVALLVSGAFNGTPAANQAPAGSSTTGTPTTGRIPSQSASGAARTSGPSGAAGPSTVATPGATSPKATPGARSRRRARQARPSTGSPAGPTAAAGQARQAAAPQAGRGRRPARAARQAPRRAGHRPRRRRPASSGSASSGLLRGRCARCERLPGRISRSTASHSYPVRKRLTERPGRAPRRRQQAAPPGGARTRSG